LFYLYKAANADGVIETGRSEAGSGEQLIAALKARGLFPLEIKEESVSAVNIIKRRFSRKERLAFTRQLAGLLNAGVGLEKALSIMNRLSFSREMSGIIGEICRLLQEGHSFTAALEKYPRHFPAFYISMVKAGETGGILPKVLNRLIRYQEDELNLRNFIISSLVYPIILVMVSLAVVLIYVVLVIPNFEPIFAEMDTELPILTKLIMLFGNGLRYYWWLFGGLLLGLYLGFVKLVSAPGGRLKFDGFKLRAPLLGEVLTKIAIARISLSLSMLCGSGVPLLTALSIAGDISGNLELGKAFQEVIGEVRQGSTLIAAMAHKKVFPVLAVEMIGVGEQSGNLEEMLDQVATTYETEVKQTVNLFMAVFEPLLILLMVGVIAVLAIAIIVPIFNLNSQIDPLG
jgi:general secretion pathway protein F